MTHIPDPQTFPLPAPVVAGYVFRPLVYDDLPTLHALLLTAVEADGEDRVDPLEDLQTQFDDPWSQAPVDSLTAWTPAGELVAFARCFLTSEPVGEAHCFVWVYFHPAHRAQPLEDAVFGWVVARAEQRLQAAPAGMPRQVQCGAVDTVVHLTALAERFDFRPTRYFYSMWRDLQTPIPDLALPPGMALTSLAPEHAPALHAAHQEAFSDHWGFEPEAFDVWKQFTIAREGFRPDLTLLAWEGAELAAYCANSEHAADNERNGTHDAHIGQLGTRRPWRKRGLGSALLCASMRAFRAAGFTGATLGVDAENPTGALALYERLGFVVRRRIVVYARSVGA